MLHVKAVEHMPIQRKGVLGHMAFRGKNVNALLQKLKSAGLNYRIVRTPDPWVQWQVFFQDPNGVDIEVDIEVDYDGTEVLDPEQNPDQNI